MKARSKALVQSIDLNTTHEEADGVIHQPVMALADVGCKTINVYVTTHNVYVLLAHYIAVESLSVALIMDPTSHSGSSIDIEATVANHFGIVQQLIAAHVVFGCDAVGCYHGIT